MTQLHLDLQAPTSRLDAVWSFGGSAGPAHLLLRKEVRRHMLMCRDELGFRHVRCEGILGPQMAGLRGDGSLDMDKVESVLDWLMENGLVPSLALSGPPAGVGGKLPWHEQVGALAAHVDGRYGCDAREWYFEISPCPDAAADATGPATASPADLLKSYDLAARAIRGVHAEYRVGGPAARTAAALEAFLAHAANPSEPAEGADRPEGFSPDVLRCDFVTVHAAARPGEGALSPADARQRVTAALGPHMPLLLVGTGAVQPADSSDSDGCAHAAAVMQAAIEGAASCQGAVLSQVSDVNDAGVPRFEPFHGGGGLVTVNDIRKAAFHALRLLHEHAGYHCERVPERWVEPAPGLGCLATRSEHTLRLLFWLDGQAHGAATDGSRGPTRFTIEGLPDAVRTAQIEVIRPGAGSAFEAWVEMGRPPFVNREVLDTLELASHPALADVDFRQYPPRLEPGMTMQLTMQLPFDEPNEYGQHGD